MSLVVITFNKLLGVYICSRTVLLPYFRFIEQILISGKRGKKRGQKCGRRDKLGKGTKKRRKEGGDIGGRRKTLGRDM